MKYIDCFNGDADGICALTQLRRAQPVDSILITGVKRDINLLKRVEANKGDQVTVLDISLDKNRVDLTRILAAGAEVFYSDHHFAGDIPEHSLLTTLINTTPDVCTSLLVNAHLKNAYLEWAVVGAFGDNLEKSALGLAKNLEVNETQITALKNLGIYINYNGYGANLNDLYFDPAELYRRTSKFDSALQFISDDAETFSTLENGYLQDMRNAEMAEMIFESNEAAVILLPDAAWARRVSGVFGNHLANTRPDRAHAVLTQKNNESKDSYLVSVRAPLNNKYGADEICRQFPSGGGRAAAAGINDLSESELTKFITTLNGFYT